MDPNTTYAKTGRGLRALVKKLPRDAGQVLSVIDGNVSAEEIVARLNNNIKEKDLESAITWLIEGGFIKSIEVDPFPNSMWGSGSGDAIEVDEIGLDEFTIHEKPAKTNKQSNVVSIKPKPAATPEEKAKLDALDQATAEAQARAEAAAKAKAEAENQEQLKKETLAKEKAEAEARKQAEREAKEKKEKAEAEEKAKKEAAEKAKKKAEEEARKQAEREAKEKAEAEAKAKKEAEEKAKLEALAKAEEEARQRAEEEAKKKAEEEARKQAEREAKEKAEAEAKAKKEAEEKAKLEALAKAEEEARQRAEEEAKKKAEEEARKQAEREAKEKAEAEAKAKKEAEEKAKKEEEERIKAEEKARKEAEARAKKEAEEKERREEEERVKAEEARKQAEKEAKEQARLAAIAKAEEEARKKAEREAKEKAEAEEKARKEEEERIKAEEKARKEAEAKAKKEAKEKAAAEKKAKKEAEAKRKAEEKEKAKLEAEKRKEEKEKEKAKAKAEAERNAEKIAVEKAAAKEHARLKAAAKEEEKAKRREEAKETAEARQALISNTLHHFIPSKEKLFGLVKSIKPLSIYALAVLCMLIIAAQFINMRMLIDPIEKIARNNIQDPVDIKSINISFFPNPHLLLEDITIADTKTIYIHKMRVYPNLMSLKDKLFGNSKAPYEINAITLEAFNIAQKDLYRIQSWAGASSRDQQLKVKKITFENMSINLNKVQLPYLNGDLLLDSAGLMEKAHLTTEDENLNIDISRSNGDYIIDAEAIRWRSPIAPHPIFTKLNAKAAIHDQTLSFSSITGTLYNGFLTAKFDTDLASPVFASQGNFEVDNFYIGDMAEELKYNTAVDGKLNIQGNFGFNIDKPSNKIKFDSLASTFTIQDGRLRTVDLADAMRSGNIRGMTDFKTLKGEMSYNNQTFRFNNLSLTDKQLSANGNVTVTTDQQVSGVINARIALKGNPIRSNLVITGPLTALRLKN